MSNIKTAAAVSSVTSQVAFPEVAFSDYELPVSRISLPQRIRVGVRDKCVTKSGVILNESGTAFQYCRLVSFGERRSLFRNFSDS